MYGQLDGVFSERLFLFAEVGELQIGTEQVGANVGRPLALIDVKGLTSGASTPAKRILKV